MYRHPWMDLKRWAVIGASRKPGSFGNRIPKRLLEKGYDVIPVSNRYEEVEGQRCYPSVLDVEGPIDVVDFVVNPTIGIEVLDHLIARGVKRLLLQPGSESPEIISKALAAGIEVQEGCVLVLLSWH